MNGARERTLVGLFVLVAGALLFGTILAVSGGMGVATVAHRAYFKFAGGVQAGAPVRYGGMNAGKVTKVRVDPGDTTRIEIQLAVNRDIPVKTDSVARITTLSPLNDNYLEIGTGSRQAALAPAGSVLPSAEAFGLAQLGDAAQAMLPDVHRILEKLNQGLDDLKITVARANDLLNDRNRAEIAGSLRNANGLLADARPKMNESLDHLNGLLKESRPKVSATLDNVQALTTKMTPLLDDLKTTTARANDTLGHLDSTLMENRPDLRASVVALRSALTQLNQTLGQNSANIDDVLDNLRMATENLRSLTETLKTSPAVLIRGMKVTDRKPGEVRK